MTAPNPKPGPAGARSAPVDHPPPFILAVEAAVKELEGSELARWTPRYGDRDKVFDDLVKASWGIASRNEADLVTLAGLYLRLAELVFAFGDDLYREAQFTGGPR